MKIVALALGLSLAASPLFAEGLGFEPVAPEGLDAAALERVARLQGGMPAQLPMFEQAGYGYYGAIAVPKGVELKPELLASVANLASTDEAREAVLNVCREQTGSACTVIGYIVPGK